MPKSSWLAVTLIAAASPMMTACNSATVVSRTLPAVDLVVPPAVERPEIRTGEDARLVARKAFDYGDQNAARLEQARGAYGAIVQTYGVAP